MKTRLLTIILFCIVTAHPALAQQANEATEPAIDGPGVIDLLAGGTMDAWKAPSTRWRVKEGVIVGTTGPAKLETPEWLYTKQRFGDFVFTCELKLTGDDRRNTGIYYRVNLIPYPANQNAEKQFEAPSGYEFDAAFHNPAAKKNFTGTLGDWYARPSLRVFPDPAVINRIYHQDNWNRLTLRARGNRLEYWINGTKVIDYLDHDAKGSREGVIGFQIHDGSVMQVEYRNIRMIRMNTN